MSQKHRTISAEKWREEGKRRFGDDMSHWRFVCPACGHVASVADWMAAKAPDGAIAFSCIGRYLPGKPREAFVADETAGPCNYAGGGLFALNPVTVISDKDHHVFDFAEPEARHA